MDLFSAFAEPKSEVKLEYLPDELEDALQVTQIATTPVQSNLEDEQITGDNKTSSHLSRSPFSVLKTVVIPIGDSFL